MKTITLKADESFDSLLSELAHQQNTSKSAIIREAVTKYQHWLQTERLRQQVIRASVKTRTQHEHNMMSMREANSDGV